MSDNVRVSVQWKSNAIFAGESLECTITFKNVSLSHTHRSPSPASHIRGLTSHRERWKEILPSKQPAPRPAPAHQTASSVIRSLRPHSRALKPALSLGESNGGPKQPSAPNFRRSLSHSPSLGANKQARSVSIVSLGGEVIEGSPKQAHTRRIHPGQYHTRAASMQNLPRPNEVPIQGPSPGEMSVIQPHV